MQHPMNPGESHEQYQARLELYALLEEGMDDVRCGRSRDADEFFAEFWEKRRDARIQGQGIRSR